MTLACQTQRVNEVDSIAVGPQHVPYICGQPVTVQIFMHGVIYDVCERCADEFVEQQNAKKLDPDAALQRLDRLNTELLSASEELAAYPDIAEWLEQCSLQLRQFLKGRL